MKTERLEEFDRSPDQPVLLQTAGGAYAVEPAASSRSGAQVGPGIRKRAVKVGRPRGRWDTTDLSLIAVFAALIAALAILPGIPVGALGVPITLQTLGVMLAGVVLGPTRGVAAVLLYLAAGLIGLPVFSGFSGGFGVLAGPSAGYLLAFPLAAFTAGALAAAVVRRGARFRAGLMFLSCLVASLVTIHPLGILGLMINAGLPLQDAVLVDAAFLPGDVVKNLVAAGIAVSVHRAFPRLLGHRRADSSVA